MSLPSSPSGQEIIGLNQKEGGRGPNPTATH